MTEQKNWVPVLAPLLSVVFDEKNPDTVLTDLMAIGLTFNLPLELEGRYGPRHSFYQKDTMRQVHDMDIAAQWTLARALAIRLRDTRWPAMSDRLQGIGWKLDRDSFLPAETADTEQYAFFIAGAVHDAYVHIRGIIKGASTEIFVIDGYVDESLFGLLLSTNGPRLCRVLALQRSLPPDFSREAELFEQQHGFTVQIRSSVEFHDRHIILDGRQVYTLGASIKDAGKRAFNIIPVETDSVRKNIIKYAEDVWTRAGVLR